MVRLCILLALFLLTLVEWRRGARKSVYWLSMIALFFFFALRYGQGTDYLTYLSMYANVPPLSQFPSYWAYQYNKVEIGYFYLMSFFRMFRVHYSLFVAFIALFGLLGVHRFIKRFCPLPMFALTAFFAVYSLVYMESAIRQMLAIGVALGFVLPWWADGRRIRPVLLIVAATFLHTSAALLLLLPLLFRKPRALFIIEWSVKRTAVLSLTLVLAALAVNFIDLTQLINLLPDAVAHTVLSYYAERQISLLPFLNRSLFMAIVFFLAYRARRELEPHEKLLFNLYCVGYGVYLLLMSSDLIASRTNLYFRIVDICLLPLLLDKNRAFVRRSFVALPAVLALFSFLYVKDITAAMGDAQYYSRNPLHYPYITVFNTADLLNEKFVNVKNAQAMNAYKAGGLSYDEYYRQLMRKPVSRSTILPY